jgi:hypothetical protein
MKLQIVMVLILTGSTIACSNGPVRREAAINNQTEWSALDVKMIREGMISTGMTMNQVEAAWGKAGWFYTGTGNHAWGETWEYPTQVVFFDSSGRVTEWRIR